LRTLLCRHLDGSSCATSLEPLRGSLGPHVAAQGDDERLRRAVARAKSLGLRVWLLAGGWTANDFEVAMFCPAKESVNRWYQALYVHLATAYGVDGVDVTHARFPMTSFPRGMLLCTCPDCARAAERFGFDMERMKADLARVPGALGRMDSGRVGAVLGAAMGATDVFEMLGMGSGVLEWFDFRARLIESSVAQFRTAVHAAAGEEFIFGTDTYPASLAMFVGHDHTRWDRFSDFASPLVSHVEIFPMRTLTRWTEILGGLSPGLSENETLALLYRLAGYDGLGLPERIADFALGEPDCEFRNIPLVDLVLRDTAKARLYLPRDLPSYPIIQGGGAPHLWPRESVAALLSGLEEQGHQGCMLQGTRSLVDWPA